MKNPLVTVNILSFNRKDELRITLTKVFEQDYKNIEVIVVDNSSSDGTQLMVKDEFPIVNLIELRENIGIAGWNRGFEMAKGEYVLVLDDDSYPLEKTIFEGIKEINKNDNIGVIAFNVVNIYINQSQTEIYQQEWHEFIGCGALIRRKIFFIVGGFDKNIFIYAHERDFSIRLLNNNFRIIYLEKSIVHHMHIMKNRSHPIFNDIRIYFSTISYFIILKKYLKPFNNIKYRITFTKFILNRILLLTYFSKFAILSKIIKYILIEIHKIEVYPEIMSNTTLQKYDYLNVPFFDTQYFYRNEEAKIKIIFRYILTFFSSSINKVNNIKY